MADTFAADILSSELREFGLNLLSAIVYSTPVDTGQARGNWVVTFEVPPIGSTQDTDIGGQLTIRKGEGVLNRIVTGSIPAKVLISNNLPYIERLNEGWSAQAPAKFVDSAIQRVIANG